MEILVKQLKQKNQIIAPQTTAEAVLVKHHNIVQRLDTVLDTKVEEISTPAGSGLKNIRTGSVVIVSHSNEIIPNEKPQPLAVQHDNNGHIVSTKPLGKFSIIVNNQEQVTYDGDGDQLLQMGDDFTLDDNNKIKLNWNNL